MKESTKTLHERFLKASLSFEGVKKDSVNPHFKNKYASLEAVLDSVLPFLQESGILLIQKVLHKDGFMLETSIINADDPNDRIELGVMPILAPKGDAQAFGSGLSYARRYALMTAFNLVAEDDDGNAASFTPPRGASMPAPIEEPSKEWLCGWAKSAMGSGWTQEQIITATGLTSLKSATEQQCKVAIKELKTKGHIA